MASSFIPPLDPNPNSPSSKQRRRNAALSCAECRRCSRVFPCASCVKKGCAAICPKVLHDKIGILSSRVRQLEDALAEAYSVYNNNERHPLLSDELLQIKRPLERESRNEMPSPPEAETAEAIDAVGSLSISDTGRTNFYGQTANSYNEAGSEEEDDVTSPTSVELPMPNTLPWRSHAFPFASNVVGNVEDVRTMLLNNLPDTNTVRRQLDIYWRHASWMYTPIEQSDFYGSIYNRVFDLEAGSDYDRIQSHRIAVVYMMLAIGALLDLDAPPHSYDASHYYQLGRAALSVDSIFEEQSIPAIQALLLMSHYMFLSDIDGPRWALMGLVVKLAHSGQLIGLVDRDSGRWGLGQEETYRRRSLFWEIYTYDSWQSLTYGRPPSFSVLHIDTQLPQESVRDENGEEEMSFQLWKYRFSSQCMSVVHDQVFGARTPNYKVLQQLDRKVRDFYTPPSLQVPGFGGPMTDVDTVPVFLTLQRYVGFAIREMTLFYMHRGFFARAIEDCPDDPLGSKYAPSVLAVYNSACSFVGLIKSLFSQHPALTERMWFLFTHVFSCAIVLGSIPIKCPKMALARSALSHLDSALRLFEDVSQNFRAIKVLPVLRKQRERAVATMAELQTMKDSQSPRMTPDYDGDVKREDEELATLGGKTRLVPRKASSSTASSPTTASASPRSSPAISNILPSLSYASHLSTPPQVNALPLAAPSVQPSQQVSWPTYDYHHHNHHQAPQSITQTHHPHTHGQPQAPQTHNHLPIEHQAHLGPLRAFNYTQYWQQQQAAEYSYNGMHGGPSTTYMPTSPGSMGFDYAASLRAESYLSTVHPSPMPSQQPSRSMQVNSDYSPGTDPNMAWHELVAQFNHV
ncbi:hypothetical protein B0F90DRAFT_1808515 [Multifurca ochricompacta]|uniref:Xylanolytic transcriptional activator regulatory domain-containing protein n=1 Tax=Multifurca ochricompacta TaxID=376703 RepID=A0AAD4M8V6_9AGAM|nr:hypothetical protein B0F90DRAFT_1808515 [Multifurca ochricompacta]